MALPKEEFFLNNEVLFIGYSSKQSGFSHMVYKGFVKAGINVVALNRTKSDNYTIPVYNDISQISKVPETAYILLSKENTEKAFHSIKDRGIKKILFQDKETVSESVLAECKKLGIEATVMCPLVMVGKGFHRIHRFFAGLGK